MRYTACGVLETGRDRRTVCAVTAGDAIIGCESTAERAVTRPAEQHVGDGLNHLRVCHAWHVPIARAVLREGEPIGMFVELSIRQHLAHGATHRLSLTLICHERVDDRIMRCEHDRQIDRHTQLHRGIRRRM